MAQLPSRESLEQMKRVELQKLCKEYGVKANLRNQELIEMLLNPRASPSPAPQPTRRSVSTKVLRQLSRARPSRTSSIVIHETDEEDEGEDDDEPHHNEATCAEIGPIVVSVPAPRTRKAKELQTRLGVGRPVAAGGSGPRAVTKSSSIPRGRRGKSGKAMQPTEATIEEEPDSIPESEQDSGGQNSPTLEQSLAVPSITTEMPNTATQLELETNIKNSMQPLQDSVDALKHEVREVERLKAEVTQLKTKLASFDGLQTQVETLMAQVHELRAHADSANAVAADFQQFKETWSYSRTPPNPASPQPKSPILPRPPGLGGLGFPSAIKRSSNAPVGESYNSQYVLGNHVLDAAAAHPGFAPSLLGKRHRDSLASNITGQEDESYKNEIVKEVLRPVKKRPKLSEDETGADEPEQSNPTADDIQEIGEQAFAPRVRSFSIFQGPEELSESYLDPPPPTTHLPAFFAPSSPSEAESASDPSIPNPRTTSSANASENQPHPFNFPFLPMSSTPASAMYLPNFSYPDPPASPSPANTNVGGFFNPASSERTDIFKPFGLPSPIRPRQSGTVLSGLQRSEFVNPAALTRQASGGKQREASGSDAATAAPSNESDTAGSVSEAAGTKRTMYGTELDGDSRFGDFGMEGVANGFWAGARY